MSKKDYIEKITQNLEHLTKDELKDVSILTTAQLGVRSKFSERQQLENEIANLTPQLQQQALPVVKDFVAEWYEEHKDDLDFSIFEACVNLHDDCSSDFEKWFGNSENKSIETLVRMKNGYQVEKPQLFYLKHIDMSKRNSTNDVYLKKYIHANLTDDGEQRLSHSIVPKGGIPKVIDYKFTQAEIDSMQTGSYELMPVPMEDGE